MLRLVAICMAIICTDLAPRRAVAEEPVTAGNIQVDAGIRYGWHFEDLDFNPWRTGYGGAIGYTLDNALYIGGAFDYYEGEEFYLEIPPPNPQPLVGGNYYDAMVQVGYDIGLSEQMFWRPKVGVGWATSETRACDFLVGYVEPVCRKTINSDTVIAPGVRLSFVTPVTFSIEARYVMLFNGETTKDAGILGASLGF